MKRRLGVLMDPIETIKIQKDSTFAMLLAAQARGYQMSYLRQRSLWLDGGTAMAQACDLTVQDDKNGWFEKSEPATIKLGDLDVILSRLDPPFDTQYLHDTHILDLAAQQGALVVNNPQSVRDANEKLFALQFPQCCPPTCVARDAALLRDFLERTGPCVAKPLDAMGGSAIFMLKPEDANVNVILETLTHEGKELALVQKYLPEIKAGDKRVLMIDGEPVPYALARVPQGKEFRGNLARGGQGVPQPLSERDRWIAAQIGPELRRRGLYFVGLDIIGDYLTEINVTSPTCIRELDRAYGINIADQMFIALEKHLRR
jgi:glutathione synthase